MKMNSIPHQHQKVSKKQTIIKRREHDRPLPGHLTAKLIPTQPIWCLEPVAILVGKTSRGMTNDPVLHNHAEDDFLVCRLKKRAQGICAVRFYKNDCPFLLRC
jgi:hypothetical protein